MKYIRVVLVKYFSKKTFKMTGKVPSYLVRNLVEVALSRTDPKPTRKTRTNNTLCLAIPTKGSQNQDNDLREIKALLKLHKRFENQAERVLYNGVAKSYVKDGKRLNSSKIRDSAVVLAVEAEPKNLYLKEIQSKWSLPPPSLPALPTAEESSKQLNCYSEKRLGSSKSCHEVANGLVLPALTDKPFCSSENSARNCGDVLQNNSKLNIFEEFERDLNLEENLTIVPLNKKNFASYDSLSKLYGDCSNSSPRDTVGNEKNRGQPVGMLRFSVPDSRSEDGLFLDFDEYMRDMGDVVSQVSSGESESELDEVEGGSEIGKNDGENGSNEQSLALVEYQPLYRKNVHFSEALHEVHLYSPVQNHRRRRRRRRHHTENVDF